MQEIRPLTSLRGIAAMGVMAYHFQNAPVFAHAFWFGDYTQLIDQSGNGVTFFFVLSGFILSLVHATPTGADVPYLTFLRLRLARIYPLHFIMLGVAVLFVFLSLDNWPGHTPGQLAASLLLVQAWHPGPIWPSWNMPSWSVSVEWLCYLVFPFAAACIGRMRTALQLLAILGLAFDPWHGSALLISVRAFAIGMLGFQISRTLELRGAYREVLLGAVLVVTIGLMHLGELDGRAQLVLFGLTVPLAATNKGAIASILSIPPLYFLGEISYSIYLIHLPLANSVLYSNWFGTLVAREPKAVALGLYVVVLLGVVVIATLTYTFIETPARRALRPKHAAPIDAAQRPLQIA